LLFKTKDADSIILLSDFGLSRFVTDDAFLKTACGSPSYVSPEIINGIPHGKPVDIWSAGVSKFCFRFIKVMYVMLSGCTPFYGDSRGDMFDQISRGIYDFDVPEWNNVSESGNLF
jgi:calcium/calmodulin-dependent protein kinase I